MFTNLTTYVSMERLLKSAALPALLTSPVSYASYFERDKIIKLLCKYRIRIAQKSHKYQQLLDSSKSPKTKIKIQDILGESKSKESELLSIFPPRKQWTRPQRTHRKKIKNPQSVSALSIYLTIIKVDALVVNGVMQAPDWHIKLNALLDKIRLRTNNPELYPIQSPKIIALKKERKKNCKEYRPISHYSLEEKIIITLTTRYLTDLLDKCFLDCSLAFRSVHKDSIRRSHQDSVRAILRYQKQNAKNKIWVCECDINKFYDCVNHIEVRKSLQSLCETNSIEIDPRATTTFNHYLDSYAFNKNVLPFNSSQSYVEETLKGGKFGWPVEKLTSYYGLWIEAESIGIPQGGALSCLIANIILHDADKNVCLDGHDEKLLYIRFCDDMILLHTSEKKCNLAFRRYEDIATKKKLIVHPPQAIESSYRSKDKSTGKNVYWNKYNKSKKPYLWGVSTKSNLSIPWLSFVGYQIRHDGIVRVRDKSLKKELAKQRTELIQLEKALGIFRNKREAKEDFTRKSKEKLVSAFQKKLVSMSAGRVKLHNLDTYVPAFCWTNGFKSLTLNSISASQLKTLDKHRDFVIKRLKGKLSTFPEKTSSKKIKEKGKKPYPFLGSPFSYYGFLNLGVRKKI